ncbi:DUF3750 domain-containing protein [Aureimonas sp. AU4]|uniref:DUF3750 domain-containing protein n=1 Tax=Aureimonas sp. AU4 TaxID=1638163 RepID=UPI000786561F|nr:DUF3750 domain-containing protein [Aureimonas sp. AU4]
MIALRLVALAFVLVYLVPLALAAGLWIAGSHPASWRDADWTSARLLPAASDDPEAAAYVLSARTGGLKGAVSEHSWIVVKARCAQRYERFDKVGWGSPIRRDGYAPDGRWYSNEPRIVAALHGAAAEAAIPRIRAAIADYPFAARGGYRIFPGPNSNSFTAHVMRAVPGFGAVLPPAAVGRDYPVDGRLVRLDADGFSASLFGFAGLAVGARTGLEINILGLVAGVDPLRWTVKVPALGAFTYPS